ncbi:AIM24 family protein [Anaerotignum sp. MB30-C6]|uniref:AIM24 family protein n=1 Tax=Anaerotignum sp. MB30-C6 TaxID=3070814 RepID=UPI0027DCB73A|nr:AIM24 family protein [Anaerotignum sp. MB30-C6]WMI81427.1 AIM24 family protein [Anaerotignum sp. MB30-C6]
MVTCKNLYDNENMKQISEMGQYKVFEHHRDMSVIPETAMSAYFASKMNVRRRQVLVELAGGSCIVQGGLMQWTAGQVQLTSGIKGVGDFLGKAIGSKVTKESAVKPEYKGQGLVMLEPTFSHVLLEDVSKWDGMVLDDGLFMACDGTVEQKVVARGSLSSAALGNEGLFNLCLKGKGIAVLESPVPREELLEFVLEDDEIKIDGNMAIAWSNSLKFTVERSSKTLLGSAVSGEGLVNVYRGTGRILLAPTTR